MENGNVMRCGKCMKSYTRTHFYRHVCKRPGGPLLKPANKKQCIRPVIAIPTRIATDLPQNLFGEDAIPQNNDEQLHDQPQNEQPSSANIDEHYETFFGADDFIDESDEIDGPPPMFDEEILAELIIDDFIGEKVTEDATSTLIEKFFLLWESRYKITGAATASVIKFLQNLFRILGISTPIRSYYQMRKTLGDTIKFNRSVVCPDCCTLYDLEELKDLVIEDSSPRCKKVHFPKHTRRPGRSPCNAELLEKVKKPNGKFEWQAKKEYCRRPLEDSLQQLFLRHGFADDINSWQKRKGKPGYMADVYDGRIWNEFEAKKLVGKDQLGFMLNVDWFRLFKHSSYSVGAIYLVLLNLPRTERFLRKNVILYGLIPYLGHEPPLNTFIEPLIEDLKKAHPTGFKFRTADSLTETRTYTGILVCVGCDIPAARKLLGIIGHCAILGCSKCYKNFPSVSAGVLNHSGFCDRDLWLLRTDAEHRADVEEIRKCFTTPTSLAELESNYGVRWSCVLKLENFDVVRQHVIDPMHNTHLGEGQHTTEHIFSVTKTTEKQWQALRNLLSSMIMPTGVGKILWKSLFGNFSADNWGTWSTVYSPVGLRLAERPAEHIEVWEYFEEACSILASKVISLEEVDRADELLLKFCQECDSVFGESFATINMHLSCHLREVILDFGPVYAFWLYSFERYNGLLGMYSHNQRNVEPQVFAKFLQDVATSMYDFKLLTTDVEMLKFLKDLQSCSATRGNIATVKEDANTFLELQLMARKDFTFSEVDWSVHRFGSSISLSKIQEEILDECDSVWLKKMYGFLYPEESNVVSSPPRVMCMKTAKVNNITYGIAGSQSVSNSYVHAYWCGEDPREIVTEGISRCGQIQRIFYHNVTVNKVLKPHVIAEVHWFAKPRPNVQCKFGRFAPTYSVCEDVPDKTKFIPIQRLNSTCGVHFDENQLHVTVVPVYRNFGDMY